MITIEQLLESVDLDFEPRFVTKSASGFVEFWELEPRKVANGTWSNSGWTTCIGCLKLAEFSNKPWQECIYEVPRKEVISKMETTGKIERFKLDDFATVAGVNNCLYSVLDSRAFDKLNMLVDAVNELKGGIDG